MQQDDKADGNEDFGEAAEELERLVLLGEAGAFSGAVIGESRERGGLRFAYYSGSDGGAQVFWGHLRAFSAGNCSRRDKGFVAANQVS
jgi:hypothetical protein